MVIGADLDIDPTNWHWVHCLTVPLETLNHFSPRPYKWIRYAIGVVVGAEGGLSSSPGSSNLVDYNADLVESASLYYHTKDEEKRRVFPTDPSIGRENVTDSVAAARRARFREDVAERDRVCVLSGLIQRLCDAVHLLPHHKGASVCYSYSQSVLAHHRNGGSTFCLNYTQRRSRDPTGGDIVADTDDVRNGLLLNKFTHNVLGELVAFLKVRDACMMPNWSLMVLGK